MQKADFTDAGSIPPTVAVMPRREVNKYLVNANGHPNSMRLYERSAWVQLLIYFTTFVIAAANCWFNFHLIDLFKDQLALLKDLPDPGTLSAEQQDDLVNQFQVLQDAGENVCAVDFFLENGFSSKVLETPLENLLKILHASAYLAACLFVPIHLMVKAVGSKSLVMDDFDVADNEDMKHTLGGGDHPHKKPKRMKWNVVKTAAINESLVLESEAEKKIRVYLRADTLLFGLVQLVQDIPVLTVVVLFILIDVRERGIQCFTDMMKDVTVGVVNGTAGVNPLVYGQVAIILANVVVNFSTLGARWIQYFMYRSHKHQDKPLSTTTLIFQMLLWTVGYMLALFLPMMCVLYSEIGDELIGVDASGAVFLLIMIIFGAVCATVGFFMVCCFWGVEAGNAACIGCVICEACAMGCEELEMCEHVCDFCCG